MEEDARVAAFSVPDGVTGVAEARHFTKTCLDEWGLNGAVEVAVLLVSEAVTNALLHTGACPSLRLRAERATLRVEVRDASTVMPSLKHHDETSTTGRGLHLIQALSSRWGAELQAGGKVVWFEVTNAGAGTTTDEVQRTKDTPPDQGEVPPAGRVSGRIDRREPLRGRFDGSGPARSFTR